MKELKSAKKEKRSCEGVPKSGSASAKRRKAFGSTAAPPKGQDTATAFCHRKDNDHVGGGRDYFRQSIRYLAGTYAAYSTISLFLWLMSVISS